MMIRVIGAVLSALIVAPQMAQPGGTDDAIEKLQGKWVVEGLEHVNKNIPKEKLVGQKFVIKGDKYTQFAGGENPVERTIALHSGRKPKGIDLTAKVNGKTIVFRGIYELDGDTLKTCFAGPGMERPAEFKIGAGKGVSITTYKRMKH